MAYSLLVTPVGKKKKVVTGRTGLVIFSLTTRSFADHTVSRIISGLDSTKTYFSAT